MIWWLTRRSGQKHALESIRRVAPGAPVSEFIARVDTFAAEQSDRINALGRDQRQQAPHNRAGEAANIVVRRKKFGTLPLDDLPVTDREGQPSGAWSARLITALYWCDGERTLDEVFRRTQLELGPDTFNYVAYFQFLARHGYVDLSRRSGDR